MKREYPDRPLVGVGAIIVENDRVVLVKRGHPPLAGDDAGKVHYHFVLIDFLCRRVSGELKAADDAAEARWFHWDEVCQLPLAKDTAEVIRKGLEKSRL